MTVTVSTHWLNCRWRTHSPNFPTGGGRANKNSGARRDTTDWQLPTNHLKDCQDIFPTDTTERKNMAWNRIKMQYRQMRTSISSHISSITPVGCRVTDGNRSRFKIQLEFVSVDLTHWQQTFTHIHTQTKHYKINMKRVYDKINKRNKTDTIMSSVHIMLTAAWLSCGLAC